MDVSRGKKTVTDDEIIEEMRSHRDPAFITSELAEIFGMTTEGMRVRLETLQEEGRIYKKKPTERTVIWWAEYRYCDLVD